MAVVAAIITYDDYPLLRDCIESVIDRVDRIVVIDGKYRDFPGKYKCSSDGTLEYLARVQRDNKITLRFVSDVDEVAKRNIYFQYLRDGDICLNIDADEVLNSPLPRFDTDISLVRIGEDGDRRRHRRTNRLFRYRPGLHYRGKHSLILDSYGRVFANLDKAGSRYTVQDDKVEFLHNNHKRSYNRKKDKREYYKILQKREAKIDVSTN